MSCCSPPGEDLPLYSEEELKELENLPCVAIPSEDFAKGNGLQTVYIAQYENGLELTLLFADEDRPNACMDFFYDTIRRPLFGRYSDIETVFIIKNDKGEMDVEFPGTYAGAQKWNEKAPSHTIETISLNKFELKKGTNEKEMVVLWCNTWNHLLGEANNNSTMAMSYCSPTGVAAVEPSDMSVSYECRKGTRAEVDGRFKGLMTSVSEVLTEDRATRLGARLS
mmetsp:Transcript_43893/g.65099  ORF Transcript_43893/g.65099 Transcript_43893/m.65099 type:complete len:224 (-) Transcript_43893:236-907(-)